MKIELLCQLSQRLVAFQSCHGHFRLECRRVIPSGPSHCCSPYAGVSDAHQSISPLIGQSNFAEPLLSAFMVDH
jgi:hypothetical protein